ncbi:hypothetical protein AQPE_2410 [Aquipluma nitroreducens]|uniref:Uncharacterized protein n=1 Tax=Aquipluma nitroreducens TaxID=2010828 RepID=A0A5K7S9J1_9BACT|nr:hypothetical protein AQPE_2410 [Aquipluma nitroreducens]
MYVTYKFLIGFENGFHNPVQITNICKVRIISIKKLSQFNSGVDALQP